MTVIIGFKYDAERQHLRDLIAERGSGGIQVSRIKNLLATCYFCVKPITGEGVILRKTNESDKVEKLESYCLHGECYDNARRFQYINGRAVSLS